MSDLQWRGDGSLIDDVPTRTSESGAVDGVFSPGFSSAPRSAMYQAWVFPELHPDERQPVLKNWTAEDYEEFWIKESEIV